MDERFGEVPTVPTERPYETQSSGTSEFSQRVSGAAEKGREQAVRIKSLARQGVLRRADQRKGFLASELENFAGTLDDMGSNLQERGRGSQQQFVDGAANLLRRASRELRERDTEQLVRQGVSELKARPGAVVAGCFALGFLAVRLIKG